MKKLFLLALFGTAVTISYAQQTDVLQTNDGVVKITPVQHASLVLQWKEETIYIDPAGGAELYKDIRRPNIILITDIHGDHMDKKTLTTLRTDRAVFIAPPAVADSLQPYFRDNHIKIVRNGENLTEEDIRFSAIPMYNLPETSDSRHPKGRGNGYVINIADKNIYVSGDTEDIPEMRSLKNIDIAFICMNLPYTMDINQAASAVLELKPAVVYPYHYRGQDVNEFKRLVNEKDKNIEVRIREWYPK
ncbi:MAG: fold metallo-hydrolase [Flavipsychrobacter sp.]|jgi:L-ascorbate metabolism protein UlaG (beta-lactamase superfamily)|nr:fold metallo-hydrolase [Flavipsychrobacter sp.]